MLKRRSLRDEPRKSEIIRKIVPVYLFSRKEAQDRYEATRWFDSYIANCTCARHIEIAIKDAFADNRLDEKCAERIISKFGYARVNWVLAHTVQFNGYDTRFSQEQISWAKGYSIPYDDHYLQRNFAVGLHPSLVSLFIELVRKQWKDMNFYDESHCYDESETPLDYRKKIVVIKPEIIKDEMRSPNNQLFFVDWFPQNPDHEGKYRGLFMKEGYTDFVYRSEIIGALKLDLYPDWAKEKFLELTKPLPFDPPQYETSDPVSIVKRRVR